MIIMLLLSGLLPVGLFKVSKAAASGTVTSKIVPGWTFYNSGLSAADYTLDSSQSADGIQSLKLNNSLSKASNVYLTAYQTIAVQPNMTYEWTVRVKGSNVKAGAAWFGGGVTSWNVRQNVPSGTYDWQDVSVAYTTGTAETSFTFRFLIEDTADALWFDDIRMTADGQQVQLLSNSGFDVPVMTLLHEGFEQPSVWQPSTGAAGVITSESFNNATEGLYSEKVTYAPADGAVGWLNKVWNFEAADLSLAQTVTLDVYPTTQTESAQEPLVLKIAGEDGVVIEKRVPQLTANRWNTVQFDLSSVPAAVKEGVSRINLYVKTSYPELEGRPSVTYAFDNLTISAFPEDTVYPWDSFRSSFGSLDHVAVMPADNITVDGSLDEWDSATEIALPSSDSQVHIDGWGGANDLSATAYFAYDDQNLYVAATVVDDVYHPLVGSAIWKGDSIQIAFGNDGIYGPEIGINDMDGTANVTLLKGGNGTLGVDSMTASATRAGNETYYEIKLPWAAISNAYTIGDPVVFSMLINDNDNTAEGRRGWIEWTPGIASAKEPDAMGLLYFLPDNANWAYWVDGPRKPQAGAASTYHLYVTNFGNQKETYEVDSTFLNVQKAITVPAHSVFVKKLDYTFAQSGEAGIDIQLTDEQGSVQQSELVVKVPPFPEELEEKLDELAVMLPDLEDLLSQCEEFGIPTDYERINYAVISRFIEYGRGDVVNGRLDRADYVIEQLQSLYDEAVQNLNNYISGASMAVAVPRYVTGRPVSDGYAFVGNTVTRSTYEEETRPIFFNGYGHFSQVRKDVPYFQDFGANIIQIETGPRNVIFSKDDFINQYSVYRSGTVDADIVVDETYRHSGTHALKLENDTPKTSNVYINVSQNVTVKPDTTYTFSAWVKGENAKNVWFPGGQGWHLRTPFPSGTYDWQEVELEYTTNADETSFNFTILSENAGTVWIDDLSMTELGTTQNLLLNPGFENMGSLPPDRDYAISTTSVEQDIVKVLQNAAQNNVAVNLLLSPHYFPSWALSDYPELKSNNTTPDFTYVITHPLAKQIIEDYLRAVIPLVKDYSSLHSVTLSNEPQYHSNKDSYNLPAWYEYLHDTYDGDLSELNLIYGTWYASFEDVPMPADGAEPTPVGYDWVMFNDNLMTDWQTWMSDIIHEIAPNLPVHAKIMARMESSPQYGIDVESFSNLTDLNGNDNWNFIDGGMTADMKELSFYDLQASIHEAPIYNSEHHVIEDGDSRYSAAYGDHIRSLLWQGAIHGKSASTIWIWQRTYNTANSSEGGILHRPESVAAVGKANFDLNRLSREVTAFQNIQSKAAILYSVPSMLYNGNESYPSLLKAYEALSFTGEKVGFITENQMAQGDWSKYKVLIVPDTGYIHADTLEQLWAFQVDGGQVIVLGEDSLQYDEHNQPLISTLRSTVMDDATVVSLDTTAKQFRTQLYPILYDTGMAQYQLIDTTTLEPVYGVEWRVAEYNGHMLLNVMNDGDSNRTVTVERNNAALLPQLELVSGEALSSGTLTLKPNTPYLFDLGDTPSPEECGS